MNENFNLVQSIMVNQLPNGNLHSQCSYLSTFEEASAWISADTRNLRITGAGVEVYRSLREKEGYSDFPELVGIEAYLQSGAQIKKIIGPDHQIARNLLLQCIKGVIQVEAFICTERGYPDLSAYIEYWRGINNNTCYPFTHNNGEASVWSVNPRNYNLFNRTHVIQIHKDKVQKSLYGTFIDTHHELTIQLLLDNNNVVLKANVDFIRVPGESCSNSAVRLQDLVGHNLPEMNNKQVKLLIGGPEGCIHLTEIVYEALLIMKSSM